MQWTRNALVLLGVALSVHCILAWWTLDGKQYGNTVEGVPDKWTGKGVTLFLIDSGIEKTYHTSLDESVSCESVVPGVDCYAPGHTHGTRLTSVVKGYGNQLRGVTEGTNVRIIRVFDVHSRTSYVYLFAALQRVWDQIQRDTLNRTESLHPYVITLALGVDRMGEGDTEYHTKCVALLRRLHALNREMHASVFILSSAGNDGPRLNRLLTPFHDESGSLDDLLFVVGSFTEVKVNHSARRKVSLFSSRGPHSVEYSGCNSLHAQYLFSCKPDVLAPGSNIAVFSPEKEANRSLSTREGTSYAAVVAASMISLLYDSILHHNTTNKPNVQWHNVIKRILLETADAIREEVPHDLYSYFRLFTESCFAQGAGVINFSAALKELTSYMQDRNHLEVAVFPAYLTNHERMSHLLAEDYYYMGNPYNGSHLWWHSHQFVLALYPEEEPLESDVTTCTVTVEELRLTPPRKGHEETGYLHFSCSVLSDHTKLSIAVHLTALIEDYFNENSDVLSLTLSGSIKVNYLTTSRAYASSVRFSFRAVPAPAKNKRVGITFASQNRKSVFSLFPFFAALKQNDPPFYLEFFSYSTKQGHDTNTDLCAYLEELGTVMVFYEGPHPTEDTLRPFLPCRAYRIILVMTSLLPQKSDTSRINHFLFHHPVGKWYLNVDDRTTDGRLADTLLSKWLSSYDVFPTLSMQASLRRDNGKEDGSILLCAAKHFHSFNESSSSIMGFVQSGNKSIAILTNGNCLSSDRLSVEAHDVALLRRQYYTHGERTVAPSDSVAFCYDLLKSLLSSDGCAERWNQSFGERFSFSCRGR
ncbi:hypothetical protein AGDE_15114 [Angomonas deanei]|uniref:Subtilase family, putative n=1 Tax=Angomonas deanei TaxID=59799 RepID=A0A7G2CM34_9TRYP|nr:hypothetical protein AGDE_15114 [Angomonas deanei]CAD2219613.1 Subtilase family, putative [Angomonas deanei]|eukprot:EPY19668.1 hypothetical protein AGDE_15114 [Angomonas deanei]